jgi:uncharacterized protein (TIGR02687 family)
MDKTQIDTALNRLFHEQGNRIVFWNDTQREFEDTLATLAVPGIKVLRLDQEGTLAVKIRVEREDPMGRYLIYAPTPEPDYDDDWLLDIRLYSHTFRADRASIIMDDLGLANQSLRPHIDERKKFFDNKERFKKLQGLVSPQDTGLDLDQKMLAVLVKAEQPDAFSIVLALFHSLAGFSISSVSYHQTRTKTFVLREGESVAEPEDELLLHDKGEPDLGTPPPAWELITKLGLEGAFWQTVKTTFGYIEDAPTLRNLLIRLLLTDYAHHLNGGLPTSLQHLVLSPATRQNVVACLSHWRDSASRGSSYDRLSGMVADILKLESHLDDLDIDALLNVMTFLPVEKAIARSLRDRVRHTADSINAEDIRKIAQRRQDGHWASLSVTGLPAVPRKALHAVYDALIAAADFFALRNQYRGRFDFADAKAMYHAYETELYQFDQLYRYFCETADLAEAEGWGLLKPLRQELEACYRTWFVATTALTWGKFIDPAHGQSLLKNWQIEKVSGQQEFYASQVKPRLDVATGRKVYVIISDAFRYEAAQELTRELNGKYRFEAVLTSQLSVLPSYTALGMASLLPHQAVAYKPTGEVLVDGKLASSLPLRSEILATVEGVAIKGEDLLAMRKDEGREFVREKMVIYVYHNTVDATGDYAPTEGKTFEAVRKAINEIASLVGHIINNLNGSQVLITADHGFLFQESAPEQTDKSVLTDKPDGTVITKKRYLLGFKLPEHDGVWHGFTATTANAEGDMEFWIPKGVNRFHFSGGARFIHGGAMLQEVVVPIIEVKHIRGKAAPTTKSKQVAVHVLGNNHKITTSRHRFELLQTEAVSDRVKATTLKVAIYDADEAVTNIETVTFDSASDNMNERKKWVSLVLLDRHYDKRKPYRLVLREAETGIEQQGVEVAIDRAFTEDF